MHFNFKNASVEEVAKQLPSRLYKYRSWDNNAHKLLLTHQEIFFADPYTFEDEKDCRFPVDLNLPWEDYKKIGLETYNQLSGLKPLKQHQLEVLLRYRYDNDMGIKQAREEEFYKLFNCTIGICCFCESSNIPAMWDKYAKNDEGFCIGIDFRECLENLLGKYIGGGKVNYLPKNAQPIKYVSGFLENFDEMLEFFIKMVNNKYIDWRFEEEYRLFKFIWEGYDTDISDELRKVSIPKTAFKEVIFGRNMPNLYREEIKMICIEQGLNVSFSEHV